MLFLLLSANWIVVVVLKNLTALLKWNLVSVLFWVLVLLGTYVKIYFE